MTTPTSLEQLPNTQNEHSPFDALSYLKQRAEKDAFVMVEFGHRYLTTAYQQSRPFRGNRAYIGYENWMSDPSGEVKEKLFERHGQYSGESTNIHFQTLALGGVMRSIETSSSKKQRWFEGEFNAATQLPDESVEEVLFGNVFGDPYLCHAQSRTDTLLGEATRILNKDGVIVIRETITPNNSKTNAADLARWPRMETSLENSIKTHDLTVLAHFTPEDEEWSSFENQYMSEPYY